MSALRGQASAAGVAARPGLRERKKAKTRATIREQAFRLFREQGYDATTVEQIADAAEVSPSTFFRYFPSKEDVVLQDEMELRWLRAIRAQPPEHGPLAAIRATIRESVRSISPQEMTLLREARQLALTVPAVRARSLDQLNTTIQDIGTAVAERAGKSEDDFAVVALAGAIIGIAMACWYSSPGPSDLEEYGERFERGLALLEAGLPL